MRDTHQLESRMREIRPSGSVGGAEQTNAPSLPLSSEQSARTSAGNDPAYAGRFGAASACRCARAMAAIATTAIARHHS